MSKTASQYKRVLLKVSGDAFARPDTFGIDPGEVESIARQCQAVLKSGVELAIVVGGGNIVRGDEFAKLGFNQVTADYMGMVGTVLNGLALQDALERLDTETRLMTALWMQEVAEPYIRRRAIRHLEKGRIVILAGGTGNPHFTTDTAAAVRATEIEAEVFLKATKVDGVYSADPFLFPEAKKYERLSYMGVLSNHLGVMDPTAVTHCMHHGLPIIVFDVKKKGNIERAVRGEPIGTLVGEISDAPG